MSKHRNSARNLRHTLDVRNVGGIHNLSR
jgi:hypothetical protein